MQPTILELLGTGTPIWVVPGWGSGPLAYQPLLTELNSQGNPVFFLPIQRRGGQCNLPEYRRFRSLGLQAANVYSEVIHHGLDKLVIIGHSMGGAIGRIVAARLQDVGVKVRLIQLCSACVHPDNPIGLTWRLVKKGQRDKRYAKALTDDERIYSDAATKEGLQYIRANPLRSIAEGWVLGRRVPHISALGPNLVDSYWVAGSQDTLFSAERLHHALATAEVPNLENRFIKLPISHDPQYKPHEAKLVMQTLHDRSLLTL